MATKKLKVEPITEPELPDEPAQDKPDTTQEQGAVEEAGPIPGTVRLVNLTPGAIDITLLDGTNLRLGPKRGTNRSPWIPKKHLHPVVKAMAARREIRIEEATQ
ncbi:MAG: hypothetical protein AB1646_25300 [Thermodesulfobacteriota bacterium]